MKEKKLEQVLSMLIMAIVCDQENVDYLNSITSYWSIYKHWIEFYYKPKNVEELEATLYQLLKSYN